MKQRKVPANGRQKANRPSRANPRHRQAEAAERTFRSVYGTIVVISIVLIIVFSLLIRGKIGHMLGDDGPENAPDYEIFPYHSLPSSEGTTREEGDTEPTDPWTDTWVPTNAPTAPIVTVPSATTTTTGTVTQNTSTDETTTSETTSGTDDEPPSTADPTESTGDDPPSDDTTATSQTEVESGGDETPPEVEGTPGD